MWVTGQNLCHPKTGIKIYGMENCLRGLDQVLKSGAGHSGCVQDTASSHTEKAY